MEKKQEARNRSSFGGRHDGEEDTCELFYHVFNPSKTND